MDGENDQAASAHADPQMAPAANQQNQEMDADQAFNDSQAATLAETKKRRKE
jgi:hypothetical protein